MKKLKNQIYCQKGDILFVIVEPGFAILKIEGPVLQNYFINSINDNEKQNDKINISSSELKQIQNFLNDLFMEKMLSERLDLVCGSIEIDNTNAISDEYQLQVFAMKYMASNCPGQPGPDFPDDPTCATW